MSIKITKKLSNNTVFTSAAIEKLGVNLLENNTAQIVDSISGEIPKLDGLDIFRYNLINTCLSSNVINAHLDIFSTCPQITFDLGKICEIDNIFLSSFSTRGRKYVIAEFELYASDIKEKLFSEASMLVHECNNSNDADWLYEVKGKLRFFGIKILKSNLTDDITRIKNIGLYCDKNTESKQFIAKNFTKNILEGMKPECLTDGIVFVKEDALKLTGGSSFNFELKEKIELSKVWAITEGKCEVGFLNLKPEITQIKDGFYKYVFELIPNRFAENIELLFSGNALIHQVGAFSAKRNAEVEFKNEINTDFIGIGANVLPMSFMEKSMQMGYNEVYWELERCRIMKAKPNIVRMWFQPDWVAFNYDDYKNGNYSFDNNKMYSVYKYLDAFRDAGTEVLIDFGWKVSSYAQEWFSFPEIPDKMKSASAPKELDLFAKCCAETLNELIKNRGYSNIKYLTFYNEPANGEGRLDVGDFIVDGYGKLEYWLKMLNECRKEVDKKELGIKYWGCEISGNEDVQAKWIEFFKNNSPLDCYTGHVYKKGTNYSDTRGCGTASEFFNTVNDARKDSPFMISECCQTRAFNSLSWDMNHLQFLWELTRHGISGAMLWCLNCMYLADPLNFKISNGNMWDVPQTENGIHNIAEVFYEWAMISHYVPAHSVSVSANVDSDDIRATAYKTRADDYTLILELNKSTEARSINVKLDTKIGKKLYKHVLKRPICCNANMIIPPTSDTMFVDDVIEDIVTSDYQVIVYTTIEPVGQIELSMVELNMSPNKSLPITARTIDCDGEVAFKISKTVGNPNAFFISADNLLVATKEAKFGDMCAIRAYSVNNPNVLYSVMVCKIGEC